jgi:hypothetical protein
MIRSDEQNVAKSSCNETSSAENECTHEDFAELCIGLYQIEKFFPLYFDELTRFDNADRCDYRPTGNDGDFAGKLSRSDLGYGCFAVRRVRYECVEFSGTDNKKERGRFTGSLKDFTWFDVPRPTV